MKTLLIIILVFLSGCGPSFYLRKAERALKKAEQLGATINSDTVFVEKIVPIPEIHTDSIVVVKLGDTVTVEKERLKIKLVRLKGDTVFVEGKCESDTVKIRVPYSVSRTIQARGWLRWYHVLLAFIIGIFLGRIILKTLL